MLEQQAICECAQEQRSFVGRKTHHSVLFRVDCTRTVYEASAVAWKESPQSTTQQNGTLAKCEARSICNLRDFNTRPKI